MTPSSLPSRISPTEQAFAYAFERNPTLRQEVVAALYRMGLHVQNKTETWDDLLSGLTHAVPSNEWTYTVETVQELALPTNPSEKCYPLGWLDQGRTFTLNLAARSQSGMHDGPGASIVVRKDASYPGLALHYTEWHRRFLVQLF